MHAVVYGTWQGGGLGFWALSPSHFPSTQHVLAIVFYIYKTKIRRTRTVEFLFVDLMTSEFLLLVVEGKILRGKINAKN